MTTTQWTPLQPEAPAFLFIPVDDTLKEEYERGVKVTDVFPLNGWGIATRKDYLLVDMDRESLYRKFERISKLSATEAVKEFDIAVSKHWNYISAHKAIANQNSKEINNSIKSVLFRPFDERFVYYEKFMIERGDHRFDLMSHMMQSNMSLITVRRNETTDNIGHFFCSNQLSVLHSTSSKEGNFVFPLYLYPSELTGTATGALSFTEREPNFSKEFLQKFSAAIGRASEQPHGLPQGVSAEQLFAYIYAVLHAPTYRARYAPFLRLDFPRVPLPQNAEQFFALSKLGAPLVALHTLDSKAAPILNQPRHKFIEGEGNSVVRARVHHDDNDKRVYINSAAYFENVDSDTFAFRVGGYTPAERWLKDRDGRVLSYDDQAHYRRLLIAQSETLLLLPAIDAALGFVADEDNPIPGPSP